MVVEEKHCLKISKIETFGFMTLGFVNRRSF